MLNWQRLTAETKRNTIKCENSTLSNGSTTSQILILAGGTGTEASGLQAGVGDGPLCIWHTHTITGTKRTSNEQQTTTAKEKRPTKKLCGEKVHAPNKTNNLAKNLAKAIAIARWWEWGLKKRTMDWVVHGTTTKLLTMANTLTKNFGTKINANKFGNLFSSFSQFVLLWVRRAQRRLCELLERGWKNGWNVALVAFQSRGNNTRMIAPALSAEFAYSAEKI